MIDLHMHSRYSEDGEYTPEELAELCRKAGVEVMSVTDHNCAKANGEARAAAECRGLRYIPGIEIDCTWRDLGFHVLGYGIDPDSGDFDRVEKNVEEQSFRASLERLDKTLRLGFCLQEQELRARSEHSYWRRSWTGELFAEVLLAKPEYADHPLLAPYRPGGARGDNPCVNFYWDYYAQGRPCYAEVKYPSVAEIVEMIHDNGGRAVLAHPGVNLKGREGLLDGILNLGMDGIEAFSSYHTPEQAAFFARRAKERGLFCTCGSDFHGRTKPSVRLGGYPHPANLETFL